MLRRRMAKPVPKHYVPNFWRRLGLQVGTIVLVVAVLALVGYKAYSAWTVSHLLKQARGYLDQGNYRSAIFVARNVLNLRPANREAAEIAAEAAEKDHNLDALGWRQFIVQISPNDVDAALKSARTAIRFGEFPTAEAALLAIPEKARQTGDYQQMAAGVKIGLGKPLEAGPFFAEAVKLEPKNPMHRFNDANWVLEFDANADHRRAAEATMNELLALPEYSARAHRALLNVAVQSRQWKAVLMHSEALTHGDAPHPVDWVRELDALEALQDPRLDAEVARAELAAKDPLTVVAVAHWMQIHGRLEAANSWAATLDEKLAADSNVAATMAEGLDSAEKWAQLRKLTDAGNWKDKDALRAAYGAHARKQLGDLEGASSSWLRAQASVHTPEIAEQIMLRTAKWGWRTETSDMLWALAEGPHYAWALGALDRFYRTGKDTAGMLRVARALVQKNSANEAAQNNVAALSLLLDRDVEKSAQLAADLYARHPQTAGIVSTHALGLFKRGRTDEALKVLETCKPEELRHPAVAATYGVLLAAAKRPEAREILEIAAKAPLLPEEKALVEKAMVGVR